MIQFATSRLFSSFAGCLGYAVDLGNVENTSPTALLPWRERLPLVYEIPPPDREGARRIAQSIYDEIRSAHAWGQRFPAELGDLTLDALARASPREMRRAILNGFGAARISGRDHIAADDIRLDHAARRKPIGF